MAADRLFARNLSRVALTTKRSVIFPGVSGPTVTIVTEYPQLWSMLLQQLAHPITEGALRERPASPPDLTETALEQLVSEGVLLEDEEPGALLSRRAAALNQAPAFCLSSMPPSCGNLLFGCSGSVVTGLMVQTLLSLSYTGFQERLDVILTETAARFLTRDLLDAYGVRCWTDTFESQDGIRVPHVALAREADVICVLPATANALDRIARSACSDLLSLCITASSAPLVLCPAMNDVMWNNAGVQRNVQTLRDDGHYILEPTIIFGAASFERGATPMYGGHGTLWSGPAGLIKALSTVLELEREPDGSRTACRELRQPPV